MAVFFANIINDGNDIVVKRVMNSYYSLTELRINVI